MAKDKRDNKRIEQKPLWVDPETHRKIKMLAAARGKTIKEVVGELAEEGLKK